VKSKEQNTNPNRQLKLYKMSWEAHKERQIKLVRPRGIVILSKPLWQWLDPRLSKSEKVYIEGRWFTLAAAKKVLGELVAAGRRWGRK
jgi:hypothetical protein